MMKFEKNIEERKVLVRRLGELTGISPYYTRVPRCAYEIGVYTVERDGSLTVEEAEADPGILAALKNEGLIRDAEGISEAAAAEETAAAAEEPGQAEKTEEPGSIPVSEYGPEVREEAGNQEETAAHTEEEQLDLAISFPMGEHTGVSLRNLVNMVYSRGPILSKASGGSFHVSEELVGALKEDTCTATVQAFLNALADHTRTHGGLEGLQITEQHVSFTGFPVPADRAHAEAFCQLAAMMNAMALSQKRIQAKEVSTENEKYAFRIWLLRLGMNGDACKAARKVLMENLSGHAAFRTPEEAEKAKARNKAKREAEKTMMGGGRA